jgi:adenylate cyclase
MKFDPISPFTRPIPLWLFLVWLSWPGTIWGQALSVADSLSNLLEQSSEADTNRIIWLNDLAWEFKFDQPEQARTLLDSALTLSQSLNYQEGKADAYNYRGVVEDIAGNTDQAIFYFEKALQIRQEMADVKGQASLYNNIGNLRSNQGKYVEAMENYLRSLKFREQLQDTIRMGRLFYNIGDLHEKMTNYPEALDYIYQALEIYEQTGTQLEVGNVNMVLGNIKYNLNRFDESEEHYQEALEVYRKEETPRNQGMALNNLGNINDIRGQLEADSNRIERALELNQKALNFYQQAKRIFEELEDGRGLAEVYNNLGVAYKYRGSMLEDLGQQARARQAWDLAMDFFDQSLQLVIEYEDLQKQMEVYNGIGDVLRRQEKYSEALDFTQKYLTIADSIDSKRYVYLAYKDLSRLYSDLGDYEKAYKYRKEYDQLKYDVFDAERAKVIQRREVMYSDRKKQIEIERQQQEIKIQDAELKRARVTQYSLIGGTLALILLALLLYNRYRIKTRANRELAEKNDIIDQERRRSEDLLLNILPAATAKELKLHGKTQAKKYESVSVLFTDFKSFTQIAERMSPEDLVAELDECFRAFDRITAKHNVEKIKTIGDAYMCVGGLPEANDTHPRDVVAAALEMQEFMRSFNGRQQKRGNPVFHCRIGIHTGPVVAGVVGSRKFAYDVWGDTVNMAARMESSGEPGEVNISESTYLLVKDVFTCVPRGRISAKNKGEVDMYFVTDHPGQRSSEHLDLPEHLLTREHFEEIKALVVNAYENKVDKKYTYHNLAHTLDVLAAAREIAQAEGIEGIELRILEVAALFHDLGFMQQAEGHEAISCEICREWLKPYGYPVSVLDKLCELILGTEVPQRPVSFLGEILCDADLDYLGRNDFKKIGDRLFQELQNTGKVSDRMVWDQIQINFLEAHQYFTRTNQGRRKSEKAIHLQELKDRLTRSEKNQDS